MALRISHLSVDARDAHARSRWWAQALGRDRPDPYAHLVLSRARRTRVRARMT